MTSLVLVVEDNPLTRQMVRLTLESDGLTVIEAGDARSAIAAIGDQPVALVVQDLWLPDMDGFDLITKLRAVPIGTEIPILAFTGTLSRFNEARVSAAGFDDVVSKPVDPARLLHQVRTHLLPASQPAPASIGEGRRLLLVVDDDPVQRKLLGRRMGLAGFEVIVASDGAEALRRARLSPPDAIVADFLMVGMNGFSLCREVRGDASLANVRVLLTTNSYIAAADRALARQAGAQDLVLRTPDLREVLAALSTSLGAPTATLGPIEPVVAMDAEHLRRKVRELDRQVALSAGVTQRAALVAAELAVLKGMSEALATRGDVDEALRVTLAACFDAGGFALGALYLKTGDALRALSFGMSEDWSESALLDFFGERALLDAAIDSRATTVIRAGAGVDGQRMLTNANVESALIVPVGFRELQFGALVVLLKHGELASEDRVEFAKAIAGQISQALAVAHAFREKEGLERAANEQSAILRSMLESIGDGVCVVDGDGRFILWNAAATDFVKMSAPPSDAASVGAEGADEASVFGVYDSDTRTRLSVVEQPLARATRGESVDGVELFVRHEHAPEGVWLSATSRPWHDGRGHARGGVAVLRDVTRERATQAQLMVSDRMASVGMLAAGVAHEINNPLACVVANLELSCQAMDERPVAADPIVAQEVRAMLGDARGAANRVRQIVSDLKMFSRDEDTRALTADLRSVLESTVRMAWNEIRHRARLVVEYGDTGLVEGSDSRLGQVFLNLLVNAAQAIPEGDADGNIIRIASRKDLSGRVVVDISDSGSGIAPENLRHLFTPFFTTKEPGVGTGLGLPICHRIIMGLGGELLVRSELGKGTTFTVILEAAADGRPVSQAAPPLLPRAATRGRVLVIDDDPMVGTVIARTLAKEHDVVATISASDGLARLRGGERYDVILCDLMMPQMTGAELYTELHTFEPALAERMIFLTGGAFTTAARTFLDTVANAKLEKPFNTQELRGLVNERVGRGLSRTTA